MEARTSEKTECQLGVYAVDVNLSALANSRPTDHRRGQTGIVWPTLYIIELVFLK